MISKSSTKDLGPVGIENPQYVLNPTTIITDISTQQKTEMARVYLNWRAGFLLLFTA